LIILHVCTDDKHRRRGLESCNFPKTLQISDRIVTDRCKFLTEETMGAQNFNFAPKFAQHGEQNLMAVFRQLTI